MKLFAKTLLALYTVFLLWLILFKTSVDVSSVLGMQLRELNLVPFMGVSRGSWREMADNLVVFVPLGLLLGVNLKQVSARRKLAFVFGFSLIAEVVQYVLAIGVSDITDVIMNTLGGLVGLGLYGLSRRYVADEKQDRIIVIAGAVLLTAVMLVRFLILRVRY